MRSYHVVLTSLEEADIRAQDVRVVEGGALVFHNGHELVRVYAPGTWVLCEVERVDDKTGHVIRAGDPQTLDDVTRRV